MIALAEEILKNFDRLSDAEQIEVALAIWWRLADHDYPPLTDEALALNATELFRDLDCQENATKISSGKGASKSSGTANLPQS